MTIQTQNLYGIGIGTAPGQGPVYKTTDPTSYTTNNGTYPLYQLWINTTTRAMWFLESYSISGGVKIATWRSLGPVVVATTDPTTADYQYPIGQTWVNTSSNNYWGLTSVSGTTATWQNLTGPTQQVSTLTGNSGGAVSPTANNINTVGTGSITIVGNPATSTLTTELTGLTNHALLVGAGTATITNVGPSATTGQVLQSQGAAADPAFSTATYPSTATGTGTILRADGTNWVATTATYPNTVTSQQILYASAANVVGQLTTANSSFPATNSSGTLAMRALSVNIQIFTGSGTYTPTTGMIYCIIECVGGGGGGGGAGASTAGNFGVGAGGGSGSYSRIQASAATIGASQTVTVGSLGTGGSAGNNSGNAGTASSVGVICVANGGGGGGGNSGSGQANGGAGGTAGTGTLTVVGNVGRGGGGGGTTTVLFPSGDGAPSIYGAGGAGISAAGTAAGKAATAYGAGGSGGMSWNGGGTAAGGNGSAGVVIITEYVIN